MDTMILGIKEQDRVKIAAGLKRLLADSYTLYLQTHNFHWNVTGPQFRELHLMFEEHYTELAVAVDDIAERIRTLDVIAPGTYKAFAELSSIEEVEDIPAAMDMVEILNNGHEQVVRYWYLPRNAVMNLLRRWSLTVCVFTRKPHGCFERCSKQLIFTGTLN